MAKVVTLARLRKLGACKDQLVAFKSHFGAEVEVTRDLCIEHASVFDWNWAAKQLLSPAALAEYRRATAPALAEYRRATAPAWAEYQRAVWRQRWPSISAPWRAALAEYERAAATAWRATAATWAEYERATAAALAEYECAVATAWADAFELSTPVSCG